MDATDEVEKLAALAGVGFAGGTGPDWAVIEQALGGLRLPDDYRKIVDIFPHGKFKELIAVIRPGILGGSDTDYLGHYSNTLEDYRKWRERSRRKFRYPIFPEKGGILPWADTPGGEIFFWLTEDDDPNRWPIVWADKDFAEWHRYDLTVSQFLVRLLQGQPPQEVADIAVRDLTSSAPFRRIQVRRPRPQAPAPPAQGEAVPPQLTQQQLVSAVQAGSRRNARAPQNEVAALLNAIPATTVDAEPRDWTAMEARLGSPLPPDYKTFYDTLGPGVFCDITIVGVDAPDGYNLFEALQHERERTAATEFASLIVHLHPEPGGIIPWGTTPDGWMFGWKPYGSDPAGWGFAAVADDCSTTDLIELSFSTFLLRYAGVQNGHELLTGRAPWSGPPTFKRL